MVGHTPVEISASAISKAEKRLVKQKAAISNLHFSTDPRLASIADDLLNVMQDNIIRLQKKHSQLLIDAQSKVIRFPTKPRP